jgi:hypothetical protein
LGFIGEFFSKPPARGKGSSSNMAAFTVHPNNMNEKYRFTLVRISAERLRMRQELVGNCPV